MPCYTLKTEDGGTMFICGKFGPHCRGGCGAPGDEFLCDYPIGKGKTCDAPLCADHAHEVAPDVHYCPGHHAKWVEFEQAGGVVQELANVVPFAKPGRPVPATKPENCEKEKFRNLTPAAPPTPPPPVQPDLFAAEPLDLNTLSPQALSAAMRGGTQAWGRIGSSERHVRYAEEKPKKPGGQRKCHCGCGGRATHVGKANGMALASGCELTIKRWVRDGR